MASLADSATGLGNQLGRYFGITSFMPAVLFVLWSVSLVELGTPGREPDVEHLRAGLTTWTPGKVSAVVVASLVLGLVVHPLLYMTTQVMEGYWGQHPLALRLAEHRARYHRSRLEDLRSQANKKGDRLDAFIDAVLQKPPSGRTRAELIQMPKDELTQLREDVLGGIPAEPVFGEYLAQQAVIKAQSAYPIEGHRILPTRLGNALRRIEDRAGTQYGLDLVTIAPHITLSAAPERAAYIKDSQQEMDLAIRLCFFGLLAAVVSAVWLITAGWWILVAGIPYTLAYVSYRGAVAAVEDWGAAISAAIDLDRFAMYETMHVAAPFDTDEEVATNKDLTELIAGRSHAYLEYVEDSSRPR